MPYLQVCGNKKPSCREIKNLGALKKKQKSGSLNQEVNKNTQSDFEGFFSANLDFKTSGGGPESRYVLKKNSKSFEVFLSAHSGIMVRAQIKSSHNRARF